MPYKIYTYADPYRIAETDFWSEIHACPQLCSSRTLVNGMVDVMQDRIDALICPLDEIIDENRVFGRWTKNIAGQIRQYGYLTRIYTRMHENHELNDAFFSALNHNKNAMLDAIRLFIELGIPASSLHEEAANKEQRLFVALLRQIQKEKKSLFMFPTVPTLDVIRQLIEAKAKKEKEDYQSRVGEGDKNNTTVYNKRIAMYDRAILAAEKWDGQKIVIHGVHQFSPVQLRFITSLEQSGVEVVFLHNFQKEFPSIYSSWNYIYQYFGAETHADQKIKAYHVPGQLPKPGHALAETMGWMCEDRTDRLNPRFKENFNLYHGMKVKRFENISDYAGYISDHVDKAKKQIENEVCLYRKPYQKIGTAAILSRMDELIYTANKDVEDLLQIYYPDYSKNRHFLSYPIGQFFSALYRLWDWKIGDIRIDYIDIRECLNSGILPKYHAEELLKTAIHLEPLFENITTYTELMERLTKDYLPRYDEVHNSVTNSTAFSFKSMAIYQEYKVSRKNVTDFIEAIQCIHEIACKLFISDGQKTGTNYFSFKKHFEELEQFLKKRQNELADKEERELVGKLLERFEEIRLVSESDEMQGTFDDLKNGIYFFLRQKETPDPNWLVKNFEQIDGDILGSKKQNRPGQSKVYHFACVSDRDMNQSVNDLLPWPLTERFIEAAYTPVDLQFQVYYAALCERSAFLRYCLFYGLYYNQCDSCISYVRQYEDETTEEFNLLRLLGVEEESVLLENKQDPDPLVSFLAGKNITKMRYDPYQMMDMFLCPYKYLFDYVLAPQPSMNDLFLYEKLFENVLVAQVWKRLSGLPTEQAARQYGAVLQQEAEKIKRFFPFWKNRQSQFADLTRKASNYFKNNIITKENRGNRQSPISRYDDRHMKTREIFGKALFIVDDSTQLSAELPKAFENLVKTEGNSRTYSLRSVPESEQKNQAALCNGLLKATMDYLNESSTPEQRVGEWCYNCGNRDICLRSYAPDIFSEVE